MIIDTFLFGWELDLLECRLVELNNVVDLFVIVESSETFQGEKKELYYNNNKKRFNHWNNKILYVNAELPTGGAWEREYAARNALNYLFPTFPNNSVILHSDVDEIPSEEGLIKAISLIQSTNSIHGWLPTMYSMAIDWLYPSKILCTMGAPLSAFESMTMMDLRNYRMKLTNDKVIEDGWHFSWLGGKDLIQQKAQAFSHTEDSVQNYVKSMGERLYTEGYHVLGEKLIPVSVDESYPKYIKMGEYPKIWNRPQ
jgi:beta-1,4-mannosyl-glycoprotein beta-1,4-N-acetylglucosaminyltransferase